MAPVHYACQKGNLEALRTLLDYGRESVLELTGHTDGKVRVGGATYCCPIVHPLPFSPSLSHNYWEKCL